MPSELKITTVTTRVQRNNSGGMRRKFRAPVLSKLAVPSASRIVSPGNPFHHVYHAGGADQDATQADTRRPQSGGRPRKLGPRFRDKFPLIAEHIHQR